MKNSGAGIQCLLGCIKKIPEKTQGWLLATTPCFAVKFVFLPSSGASCDNTPESYNY